MSAACPGRNFFGAGYRVRTMAAERPRTDDAPSQRTPAAVVLSILGLVTLAGTQPLLDLVGRNIAFLVAHDVGRLDLLGMTAAVALAVPLCLAAGVLAVRAVNARLGDVVHDVIVAVLVAVVVLLALRISGLGRLLPAPAELLAAGVLGAAGGLAYRRAPALRSVLSYSAWLAPVVVGFFLLATPARGVLLPAATSERTTVGGPTPPIVVVVFDELPVATLLDEQHEVDREAFPAFAALSDQSTFFRNATASHSSTVEAVPALLSGRYVPVNTLPTPTGHPTNLFSVLDGTYRSHALEPLTQLCDVQGCGNAQAGEAVNDYATLARDLGVLQLHLLVPDDWIPRLPPIDAGWRDFGASKGLDRDAFLTGAKGVLRQDTAGAFRRFVREIRPAQRPTLHVLHTLLPHRPWRHLPDGRRHGGTGEPSLTPDGWTPRVWPVQQSYQLHLAQTRFADLLLGQLLARLEDTGQYEEALVVVVADHGLSLLPGTPPRDVTEASLDQIAPVPLFVKLPGQTTGEITDEPVETVDVMPTVLDVLDADAPAGLDGISVFSPENRASRRMIDADGRSWDVSTSQEALFESVDRKLALFPAAGDLYRLTPPGYRHLLGRRVPPAAPQATAPLGVSLERAAMYERVRPRSPAVPALVAGEVHGLDAQAAAPVLAIAVNGSIAAVTRAEAGSGGPGPFRALLPPTRLRPGANEVAVMLVGTDDRLQHIPRRPPAGP